MSVPDPAAFGVAASPQLREVVGDVVFADPWRRLEDESLDVLRWQADADAATRAMLAQLPGLAELGDELAASLRAGDLEAPVFAGGAWFRRERAADAGGCAIRVADEPGDAGRVMVERDALPLGGDESIEWFAPSPDGRTLALGVTSQDDEEIALLLVDVRSGAPTRTRLRHVSAGGAAWLPDASALYCGAAVAPGTRRPLKRPVLVDARSGAATPLDAPASAADFQLTPQLSPDGRWLALCSAPRSRLLWLHDRRDGRWIPVFPDACDEIFVGAFAGEEYVAVSTEGAPRGRVVAAPLERPAERAAWRTLVPEGEAVIRGVARVGDDLAVHELVDGRPRVRLVALDGAPLGAIDAGEGLAISATGRDQGMHYGVPVQPGPGCVTFTASARDRAPTLRRWDLARRELHVLGDPQAEPEPQMPPVRSRLLTRAVGPLTLRCELVERADLPGDGPRPTLLWGYGGYDVAWVGGAWIGAFAPWLAAGGRLALCDLSGDGTYGHDRWRAGRRATKQRTFDEFLGVAEQLVAAGETTPAQLAAAGVSNGGMLVGVAIARRPELFGAAALLAPICDIPRYPRDAYILDALLGEYGDPRDPEQAAWMRAWSPYHLALELPAAAHPLPPTMIVCGDCDPRTPAWHARKLAAALGGASGEPLAPGAPAAPVWLRVHERAGHRTAAFGEPAAIAEWLGFLMAHAGLAAPQREAAVAG